MSSYLSLWGLCRLLGYFSLALYISIKISAPFTSKNGRFTCSLGESPTYMRKQEMNLLFPHSSSSASHLTGLHNTAFSNSKMSNAEPLYFLKYTDTNLVLRIFKNLLKSLTVTGNTLEYRKFKVGDYYGEAEERTVPITTGRKCCFGCFVCWGTSGASDRERIGQWTHPLTAGACVCMTPKYLS